MAGNEVAKLAAVIDMNTKQLDQKFKLIYGNCKKADQELNGIQRAVKRVGDAFSSWKGIVFTGLISALTALGAAAVGTAAKFEQYNISLEVLLGSQSKAKALMKELTALANVTPFGTSDLLQATQTMLSFGIAVDDVIPNLKMLGDISAGNKQKFDSLVLAFSQMSSAGRLTGQDLLQMINAGFNPLQVISQKTGKSISQLREEMEKGQIPASAIIEAFREATQEGGKFYNMMNKQSGTLIGKLSTLSDAWEQLSNNMGQLFLPIAKVTVDALIKITEVAQSATKALNDVLGRYGIVNNDNTNRAIYLQRQIDSINKVLEADEMRKGLRTGPMGKKEKYEMYKWLTPEQIAEYKAKLKELKKEQANLINSEAKALIKTPSKKLQDSTNGKKRQDGNKKKGKSLDSILSEKAALLQAQAELEIASNDYTDQQILQKKIALQKKLIELYKSTSLKGQVEQLQAQTELLNLEKQLEEQKLKDAEETLKAKYEMASVYRQMDAISELDNTALTERQKQEIRDKAEVAQLQAEVRLWQNIMKVRLKAYADTSKLTENELREYNKALQEKLNAELKLNQKIASLNETAQQRNEELADKVSSYITNSFDGVIRGTEDVKDAFRNMIGDMTSQLIRSGLSELMQSILNPKTNAVAKIAGASGTSGKSSFWSTIGKSLGFFANGGFPDTSRPFIAGERGAELIVPTNKTRVYNAKETANILGGGDSGQSSQNIQPIIISNQFNIKTLDGKEAYNVIMDNKAAIQKVVADGVQYNQGNLRTIIKTV